MPSDPKRKGQDLRDARHASRRCWGATPLVLQEGPVSDSSILRPLPIPREMDYSDYSHQPSRSSPQRGWPPHLPTPPLQQCQPAQPVPFPSPVSPGTFFFPAQTPQQPQTSPGTASRLTTSGLSLNLSGLSVASPPSLSPIGPHHTQPAQLHPHQLHAHHSIPHQPHHTHSHSHSSGSPMSPMTPVSPPSMPHVSQSQPSYNFDDAIPSLGGLAPAPDPVHSQRRPRTGSRSSSELAPEKSVPRKRSLTNTLPAGSAAHGMHQHSQSHSYSSSQTHALPHPIITTTAASPPLPTSSSSSPSSHPSHSHSLSHSRSHSSLSQSLSPQHNPPSPYEELDSGFTGIGDDPSDDDSVSPSGSFSASGAFGEWNFDSSIARPHYTPF